MKSLLQISIMLLICIIIASCSSVHQMVAMAKPVNTSSLKAGMTKQEVELALQKKPYGTIAAKTYDESHTTIEVVEYNQYDGENIVDNYWLYFKNNKLDRWERADPRGQPLI